MKPPRASSEYRCRACGYGISVRGELPPCPMCQRRDWQPNRLPRVEAKGSGRTGTMLWFSEVKNYGFVLTDDGERLYVDRDSFVDGAAPVGRCARRPVNLSVGERDGERVAVDVSLVEETSPRRARRRSPSTRSTRS